MIHLFCLRTSSYIDNFALIKVGNYTGEKHLIRSMMKRNLSVCDGVNTIKNSLHFPNGKAPPSF